MSRQLMTRQPKDPLAIFWSLIDQWPKTIQSRLAVRFKMYHSVIPSILQETNSPILIPKTALKSGVNLWVKEEIEDDFESSRSRWLVVRRVHRNNSKEVVVAHSQLNCCQSWISLNCYWQTDIEYICRAMIAQQSEYRRVFLSKATHICHQSNAQNLPLGL